MIQLYNNIDLYCVERSRGRARLPGELRKRAAARPIADRLAERFAGARGPRRVGREKVEWAASWSYLDNVVACVSGEFRAQWFSGEGDMIVVE